MEQIPQWIAVKPYERETYLKTKKIVTEKGISTVCIEANCPNRYECFSKSTATFLILGNICTRNCMYCSIKKGKPMEIDRGEPKRIAEAVKKLKLKYVVLTCVTRDDLIDGGAGHFAETIRKIKESNPLCKVEVLISDLAGNNMSLRKILDAKPDVLNHNIEVAKNLFPKMRPKGSYERSLELLRTAKIINPLVTTKSGFMLGLGENEAEIMQTIKDLNAASCDIITMGQYLRPLEVLAEVKKYYSPQEFINISRKAREIGSGKVIAGPLVRSSYHAEEYA